MSATANSDCPTPGNEEEGESPARRPCTGNSQRLTHGLHQDDVVSGALAENDGLISCPGDSAKCPRGWRWSDKSVHVPGELSHTSLIAQQRACSGTEETHGPKIKGASGVGSRSLCLHHFLSSYYQYKYKCYIIAATSPQHSPVRD